MSVAKPEKNLNPGGINQLCNQKYLLKHKILLKVIKIGSLFPIFYLSIIITIEF